MRAAVLYGKEDLRIEDVPERPLAADEVKIKTAFLGICGSDVHEFFHCPHTTREKGNPHPLTGETLPIVLGHEWSGKIVEVGKNVDPKFQTGLKVCVEPVISCRQCGCCQSDNRPLCETGLAFYGYNRYGAGATFVNVAQSNVHILPDSIPLDVGAMIEPLSVAWHAVRRSGIQPGQTALVVGSGPIGAMVTKVLKARGAKWIAVSEPNTTRAQIGKNCGADVAYNPMKEDVVSLIREATGGQGVDIAFDCAGNQRTFDCAMDSTRPLGTIVNVALWSNRATIDLQMLLWKERTLTASSCFSSQDMKEVIQAMAEGKLQLDDMISSKIRLEDIVEKGIRALVTEDFHTKILIDMEA